MSRPYWNDECDEKIICPYCGNEYEASFEDTYIGEEVVECYKEETQIFTCDKCGKRFKLTPILKWMYETETIDGEATEEEMERWP